MSRDACRRPLPAPWKVAAVLAALGGCVNLALDLWLRPHGVGYPLIALASAVLAMATGAAEGVVPVPRAQPGVTWAPDFMSLLCWLQREQAHEPCSGTTDDGREAPCECWCHHE